MYEEKPDWQAEAAADSYDVDRPQDYEEEFKSLWGDDDEYMGDFEEDYGDYFSLNG